MNDRTLFHFPTSTFSRRTRLALMHKGLEVELRDARADPANLAEARRICPLRTIPVLREPDGKVLGDSTAIAHYLDAKYPDRPRLFPTAPDDALAVLEATTLLDVALNTLVDLGTRYYALRTSPAWPGVKDEMLGRAQAALDALAERAKPRTGKTYIDAGYSAADIWMMSAILWIEGWPGRVSASPLVAQLVTLGIRLPAELSRWADAHRDRADLAALG